MTAKAYEYRVTWRREGLHRKEARFASLESAERQQHRVATSDPHWRCDESCGYPGVNSCDPPLIVQPSIQRRSVGEWEDA
jgi:hypothetical protein